jgi:predicted MFS family arabinose efflux permease
MSATAETERSARFAMVAAAGACATFLGVGLQRFAYAPLVPAMVQQGWLDSHAAGLLGAANFAGYVIGGLFAARLARHLGLVATLRAAMAVAACCFALCAGQGGMAWLAPWRTLAGAAGGALMVLAGPAIQAAVPQERRGLAAGVVFSGVGLGIITGALIVPAVLPEGIGAVWLALAAAGCGLAALSWRYWPQGTAPAHAAPGVPLPRGTFRLVAAYGLAAAAATPDMVWWPDFIARGLGHGTSAGATSWLVYGVGALIGPSVCGRLADRIGARPALRIAFAVQVAAIGTPLVSADLALLTASAMAAGAIAIGTTALALTRAREIGGDVAPAIWRISTIAWGSAQVATGFLLVWLFAAAGGSHLALFGFGTAAAAAALLVI